MASSVQPPPPPAGLPPRPLLLSFELLLPPLLPLFPLCEENCFCCFCCCSCLEAYDLGGIGMSPSSKDDVAAAAAPAPPPPWVDARVGGDGATALPTADGDSSAEAERCLAGETSPRGGDWPPLGGGGGAAAGATVSRVNENGDAVGMFPSPLPPSPPPPS